MDMGHVWPRYEITETMATSCSTLIKLLVLNPACSSCSWLVNWDNHPVVGVVKLLRLKPASSRLGSTAKNNVIPNEQGLITFQQTYLNRKQMDPV